LALLVFWGIVHRHPAVLVAVEGPPGKTGKVAVQAHGEAEIPGNALGGIDVVAQAGVLAVNLVHVMGVAEKGRVGQQLPAGCWRRHPSAG
jgi:hypothetical protein